jgi:hypothetical protein
MVNF